MLISELLSILILCSCIMLEKFWDKIQIHETQMLKLQAVVYNTHLRERARKKSLPSCVGAPIHSEAWNLPSMALQFISFYAFVCYRATSPGGGCSKCLPRHVVKAGASSNFRSLFFVHSPLPSIFQLLHLVGTRLCLPAKLQPCVHGLQ